MENLIDIGLNLMHSSFKKDRLEIIEEAKKVGVTQFIITGTNVHSSHMAAEYVSKFPGTLFSTSGVHPHDAKTCNGHTINELEKIAKSKSVVAIGECGLDYNRNFSPQDLQRKWFEAQVELAEKLDISSEGYYLIFLDVVEKAVVHCFTGTKQEAQNYIDLSCSIGVTGWICDMKRGRDLQEAVSVIPPEKLMIETDAPFLIPKNFDKKPKKNRNEPKYLPHILETIALCMGLDAEELAVQVTKNTKEFFKI